MLALGFLLMIGMVLIADGFGFHVPKGYIYAAMAFSAGVEALNMLSRRSATKKQKAERARAAANAGRGSGPGRRGRSRRRPDPLIHVAQSPSRRRRAPGRSRRRRVGPRPNLTCRPCQGYEIVATYPHDPTAFTQGLIVA